MKEEVVTIIIETNIIITPFCAKNLFVNTRIFNIIILY